MSAIYFANREILQLQDEVQKLQTLCNYYKSEIKKLQEKLSKYSEKVCIKSNVPRT